MNDLDWKQPALLGGLIVGFFSVIPIISIANCCFCAWALIGGAVASKMLVDKSPRAVKTSEGAQIGLFAGLIGAGIYVLVSLPMAFSGMAQGITFKVLEAIAARSSDPSLQETIQKMVEASVNQTAAQRVIASLPFLLMFSVLLGGFTVLGGLLGIALFEKRKGMAPPSPQYPPNYPPPGQM